MSFEERLRESDAHRRRGEHAAALALLEGLLALDAAPQVPPADRRRVLLRAGDAHRALGEFGAAEACYRQAAAQLHEDSSLTADPLARWHEQGVVACKLGDCLLEAGRLTEALACFDERGQRARQALALAPDSALALNDLAFACVRRGDVLLELGRKQEALGCFEQALSCNERAWAAAPGDAEVRRNLSVTQSTLADRYAEAGRTAEALRLCEQAWGHCLALAEAAPGARAQGDVAFTAARVGRLRLELGDARAAQHYLEVHRRWREAAVDCAPADAGARHFLALALADEARLHQALERPAEAGASLGRAAGLWRQLVRESPASGSMRRNLVRCLDEQERLARACGDRDAARHACHEGVQHREALAAQFPESREIESGLALARARLARLQAAARVGGVPAPGRALTLASKARP